MGASHILNGIDDTVDPEIINLGASSERYLYTYLKLKYLLPDNPQGDTIVLECAPTDLWEHADNKYFQDFEAKGHLQYFVPLFGKEEWSVFKKGENFIFILNYLFNDFHKNGSSFLKVHGKFEPVYDMQLTKEIVDTLTYNPMPIDMAAGNKVNLRYLKKIIDLCKEYDVKLFFIYMPAVKPELTYNQEEYYKCYNDNFSDIELLDYSKYNLPLDCYKNAHHLNAKGATIFTKKLTDDLKRTNKWNKNSIQ